MGDIIPLVAIAAETQICDLLTSFSPSPRPSPKPPRLQSRTSKSSASLCQSDESESPGQQPKETILDFEKLEKLKKNLETKNAAIKKQQKPATILNLDQLKERFSDKLAADFKDFSMADMKKRKKMMMFMN